MEGSPQHVQSEAFVAAPLLGRKALSEDYGRKGILGSASSGRLPTEANCLPSGQSNGNVPELDVERDESALLQGGMDLSLKNFIEACRSCITYDWGALLRDVFHDSQRQALVILVAWVILGLYMYSSSPWDDSGEYYTLIDSMYVMAQIITTVGYGDMCAKTKGHLLFTSFYVLTAVLTLSSILGAVADSIVRSERHMLQVAVDKIHMQKLPWEFTELTTNLKKTYDQLPSAGTLQRVVGCVPAIELSQEMSAFLRAVAIWWSFVFIWIMFFWIYPWEQRDFAEAFYMGVITLTTVGFGDKTPVTQGGKLFATVWMIGGVGAFANLVGKFTAVFMVKEVVVLDQDTLEEIWESPHFQQARDDRGSQDRQQIYRDEFIVFMLQKMQVIDEEVITKLSNNFDQLDADKNGYLDETDIEGVRFTMPIRRPPRRHTSA